MNAGQLSLEIERLCRTEVPVRSLNRIDGEAIEPRQIEQALLGAATGEPARLDAAFG
jgi:hypothetical protein